MDPHQVILASPPDRERLVAEISFNSEMWAELNQEGEALEIEFYPRRDGKPWVFPLEEALGAIDRARRRLIGLER